MDPTRTDEPMTDELERRLAAYADARLSPDPEKAAATRARVMREAGFAFATRRDAARGATVVPGGAGRWTGGARAARSAFLMAALTITITFGGVAFASDAGAPFYGLRIWWETTGLPATGDERAAAELDRLDARIMELTAAQVDGDTQGAAAAAAAYRAIVTQALIEASGDASREQALEVALGRHVEVLTNLLGEVPESARGAIEHAIGQSSKAIEKIKGKPSDPPGQTDKPRKTPKPANPNKPTDPGRSP